MSILMFLCFPLLFVFLECLPALERMQVRRLQAEREQRRDAQRMLDTPLEP